MANELILIVEDNEKNLKLARDLLQYKGFRTIEATTAEDGIELARTQQPDLVLMDIQLPGMDGIAALQALRDDPTTRDLAVVAVTAFAMKEDHERFLNAGFVGHIVKPIDIKTFPDQVRQLAEEARAAPARAEPGLVVANEAASDVEGLASGKILVVDDTPMNIKVLEAILSPRGYNVITATSGEEALVQIRAEAPDLILLDVVMPGIDGYEVCRRVRSDPTTSMLPVVMVTASGEAERVKGLEAGADDFLHKPVDKAELLARVQSLLRIKRYQDTIESQATELADLNRTLEARVAEQVRHIESLSQLQRFLSPQIAETIRSRPEALETHRREITVCFCDLRGFTAFSETAEPEDIMSVLREYHAAMGEIIFKHEGTLEHFAGDGMMVYFNDPVPCDEPAERAVQMSLAMRDRARDLTASWKRRGHQLGFGMGIATGYATLGRIGFEGRFDYGAIGTVTNTAARLCGEAAADQILIAERVWAAVEGQFASEPLGNLELKGLSRPIPAYNLLGPAAPRGTG
ncbi:MAG TPA: response regulator [Chloroflexota bacterium]